MKVLLIEPGYLRFKHSGRFGHSVGVGLLIVGNVLREKGHDVELLLDQSFDSSSCRFETYLDALADAIVLRQPDMVGFHTVCDSYPFTLLLCQALRKRGCTAHIVLGGPQATHTDLATMERYDAVDVVVRGEGEVIVPLLAESLQNERALTSVPGITFRKDGRLIRNVDPRPLERISCQPAYDLLPAGFFDERGKAAIEIEAGRGCPYNCTFCSTSLMWKRSYRLRDAREVYLDMAELCDRYGFTDFSFVHDSLIVQEAEFLDFIRQLARLNVRGFKWYCSVRIDRLKEEYVELMKQAGCAEVFVGIETGSAKMQQVLMKNIDLDKAREMIDYLDAAGIGFTASFIAGHPQEDIQDLDDTLDMALFCLSHSACRAIQLHKLTPMNGSQLLQTYSLNLVYNGSCVDIVPEGVQAQEEAEILKHPSIYAAFYSFDNLQAEVQELVNGFMDSLMVLTLYPAAVVETARCLGLSYVELLRNIHYKTLEHDIQIVFANRHQQVPETVACALHEGQQRSIPLLLQKYRRIYKERS